MRESFQIWGYFNPRDRVYRDRSDRDRSDRDRSDRDRSDREWGCGGDPVRGHDSYSRDGSSAPPPLQQSSFGGGDDRDRDRARDVRPRWASKSLLPILLLSFLGTASLLGLLLLLPTTAEAEVVMRPGAIACRCFVTLFNCTDAFYIIVY